MTRSRLATAALVAAAVAVSLLAPVGAAAAGDPLRVAAERRGFHVGAAVAIDPLLHDAAYHLTLGVEYNALVAENAFKFDAVHPAPDTYDFADTDRIADYARAHAMNLRGHTLVWYQQLPEWVRNGSFTRDEAIELLHDHISTLVGRYRGRVWAWDVVNEAVADDGSGLRTNSFWYQTIGPDYVDMAFEFAHEADPDAILYYNDYSAEGSGAKSDAVYALVRDLKARGVPIGGVGWQMHVVNGFRIGDGHRANAARLAALGLELSVTELDVRVELPATADKLAEQAATYRDVTDFVLSQPAFTALVTWGYTDKYSWIPGFFDGFGDALPFDDVIEAKPAYDAIQASLLADVDPNTPVIGRLEKSGKKLVVTGGGFRERSVILVNGVEQKTAYGSDGMLTAKKAGKKLKAGDEVQVRNPENVVSNVFAYYPE